MIPGRLIATGQLTDLGVNFATVHGLAPVIVHWVTRLAEVIFLHVNRTQKVPGGKSSIAHAHY